MSTPTQKSQPSLNAHPELVNTALELAGKGTAAIGAVVYVCGYLITSLHQSSYGLTEMNPFRARIISAGAWFLLFTAIPILAWMRFRSGRQPRDVILFIFPYYASCVLLSGFPSELFVLDDSSEPATMTIVLVVLFSVFIALLVAEDSVRMPRLLLPLLSLGLTIYFVQAVGRHLAHTRLFGRGSIALWFFGVGMATELLGHTKLKSAPQKGVDWSQFVIYFLVAVSLFATYLYPRMKASWGGGQPITAILWFTKESPIRPGQQIPVRLLDESDAGFYILGQNEKKAIFIPRSTVAAVSYSDKTADSALLH